MEEDAEEFGNPDLGKAKQFAESQAVRKSVNAEGIYEQFELGCEIKELAQLGSGCQLYLMFMKYFGFAFLLMGIISLYAISINKAGTGYAKETKLPALIDTTLGNRDKYMFDISNSNMLEQSQAFDDFKEKQDDEMQIVVMLDLVNVFLFIFFIFYYRFKSAKLVAETEANRIGVDMYTLIVRGFPKTGVMGEELQEFFSQFGGIIDV